MSEHFGSLAPGRADDVRVLEAKILLQLQAGGGGSGASNNQSGNGSPIGANTPDYVGQGYTDLGPPVAFWVSTGLTNTGWTELVGP